jgi:hypothetical protein
MQVNKSVTDNSRAVQEYKYAEARLTGVLNHVWAAYGKTWLLNGNAGSRESRSEGAITQCLLPWGVEAGSTLAVATDCNWRRLPQHLDYTHIASPPASRRQRQSGNQSDRDRQRKSTRMRAAAIQTTFYLLIPLTTVSKQCSISGIHHYTRHV